jgi:invasion protein IalB
MAVNWHPEIDENDRRRAQPRRRRRSVMAPLLWTVLIVLILIGGGLGFAWYTGLLRTPPATQTAAVPASTTGAAQTPAATGQQQAAAQPNVPQPTVVRRETFDDWILTCLKAAGGEEVRCGISQQLSHSESGATLFLWRIAQDGKGGFIGEWQTPTGLVVGRGIVLDAGTEKPVTIPFQACAQTACVAVANLAQDYIEALMGAEQANAVVSPIGGQPVRLVLSVKGLAAGLAALGAKPGQAPQPTAEPATGQ